jgi:acyl carrier protein
MYQDPRDAIRQFVMEHFPAAKRRAIGDEDSLLASRIIDSLGVLEIVQFIETEFGIMLSDDVVLSENFETIASIATLVSEQPNAARAAQQGI